MVLLLRGPFQRSPARRFGIALPLIIAFAAGLLLINFLFVDLMQLDGIWKLQFQRALPFARIASLGILVPAAATHWREGRTASSVSRFCCPPC